MDQKIKCGVSGCKYNENSSMCNRSAITVGTDKVQAHNKCETECNDFECK